MTTGNGRKDMTQPTREDMTQEPTLEPVADLPDFICFDLETVHSDKDFPGGFEEAHRFGMSCAVTWSKNVGFKHWFENDVMDLIEYLKTMPVVGWNTKTFDYAVLRWVYGLQFQETKVL